MPRYKQEYAQQDGWSRWISPRMNDYKLACCDCGLVHEVKFKPMQVTSRRGNGVWSGRPIAGVKVLMKVRRLNRATATMRAAMKRNRQGVFK